MKKLLQFFLISLFVLQTNLYPQSPIVQQIIDSVNIDSLIFFAKELVAAKYPQSLMELHEQFYPA